MIKKRVTINYPPLQQASKPMTQTPRVVKNLIIVLTLLLLWPASHPVRLTAAGPDGQTGIAGDPLRCLAIDQSRDLPSSGTVELRWAGEVETARLILTVAGSEAAHTIRLNGQPVAVAPIFPDGRFCEEGEVYYLDVPPALLVQGANSIELTDDALPGDSWSASSIRLEVLGRLAQPDGAAEGGFQVAATTATRSTINFVNSYDGSTQQARIQVPSGYDGSTPKPLLLYVHPRSNDMYSGENMGLDVAVDNMGWFYGSPQLHGSWPGTSAYPVPNPPGQYAYASLESQYDVIGTIQYLVDRYNIDPDRIYLYGQSMGAQVGEVVVAKFPSIFAAAFFNKGPSDWTLWYQQTQQLIQQGYPQIWHRQWMERECHLMINGVPTARTPAQNPFCYEQRSSLPYARNLRYVPLMLTHSAADRLVPVVHSSNLQNSVNSWGPSSPVGFVADTVVGPTCTDQGSKDPTPYYHCMVDDHQTVLNYLAQHTRMGRPLNLDIATTQAQVFYWLKVGSIGNSRWAYVQANADLARQSMIAQINAANPLVLSFNLGTVPVQAITPHAGIGLTATTYLVKEQGRPAYVADYAGGYLDVPLNSTGSYSLSIAALALQLSADPADKPAGQPQTSTITVQVQDTLQQNVPDQTQVRLTTTAGQFSGGGTTYVGTTVGGRVTASLALAAGDSGATVVAAVGNATGVVTIGSGGSQPPTATPTAIPTQTATPTVLPTMTPTPTPTSVPTAIPTAIPTATPTATPPQADDLLFADDFESNSLAAWSASFSDGGDLGTSSAAAMVGDYGMQVTIDDNNNLLVRDTTVDGEPRYRARFYFDPNSIVMAQNDRHVIFRGTTNDWPSVVELNLRRYNGRYQVLPSILNDGTTWRHGVWFELTDAPHYLEIDWRAATAPNANDGALSFWIDGVLHSELTGIDNDTRRIDQIRLGPLFGIDTGTRGTYYIDAFEARRTTYIGAAPQGVAVAGTAANPAELRMWGEREMTEEEMQRPEEEVQMHHLFLPQVVR
jgi:pimeloyl-ACP methyl ester carboxylesterase